MANLLQPDAMKKYTRARARTNGTPKHYPQPSLPPSLFPRFSGVDAADDKTNLRSSNENLPVTRRGHRELGQVIIRDARHQSHVAVDHNPHQPGHWAGKIKPATADAHPTAVP